MNSRSRETPAALSSPDIDFAGGGVALNFINTLRGDAGKQLDMLQTDRDVLTWMKRMGVGGRVRSRSLPGGALLQSARTLRELALSAVKHRKAGKRVELAGLNQYLFQAPSYWKLCRRKDRIEMDREYLSESAEQILAPIAEAVAELLASSFESIRQCEGSGCVLWFADRTKGGRRRFCMEGTCGTRTRVAAHRARLAQRRSEPRTQDSK